MAMPTLFRPVDYGCEPEELTGFGGKPLFQVAALNWTRPRIWTDPDDAPVAGVSGPCLYILFRNHGNSRRRDEICYLGITTSPDRRFRKHTKARTLVERRGETSISFAQLEDVRKRNWKESQKRTLEGLEHVLIWALSPLENERKYFTLPGLGKNGAFAWHILNGGYRFHGRMPREIIYPWMLTKSGRDRSYKS